MIGLRSRVCGLMPPLGFAPKSFGGLLKPSPRYRTM